MRNTSGSSGLQRPWDSSCLAAVDSAPSRMACLTVARVLSEIVTRPAAALVLGREGVDSSGARRSSVAHMLLPAVLVLQHFSEPYACRPWLGSGVRQIRRRERGARRRGGIMHRGPAGAPLYMPWAVRREAGKRMPPPLTTLRRAILFPKPAPPNKCTVPKIVHMP